MLQQRTVESALLMLPVSAAAWRVRMVMNGVVESMVYGKGGQRRQMPAVVK